MGEMLKFPLTPVPICLAHIDRSMQKTPKSSLLKELETQVMSETSSNIDSLVIDDMFFLRLLKELPETFGRLAKSILKEVCAVSNAHRIDLIFDKTIFMTMREVNDVKIKAGRLCMKQLGLSKSDLTTSRMHFRTTILKRLLSKL